MRRRGLHGSAMALVIMGVLAFALLAAPSIACAAGTRSWQNPLPQGNSLSSVTFTRPPAGAVTQLGAVDWMSTLSYGMNWAIPDFVSYYTDSAGKLAIVNHGEDGLTIDTFEPSTLQHIGATKSVSLAGWPDWGGFCAGSDGCFYVLIGRENPTENDNLDVVALRRYDRNWVLLGTAYVKGGVSQGVKGIYSPFSYSAAHMVLTGNRLVVDMGRLIYAIEGVHHQVNLTFEVDVDTMTATTFEQLGGYAYSSHSFQQLVAMNGTSLVMIDHGDAYPRAIQMGVMADYPAKRNVFTYDLFEFNGAIGDNFTGATVTGLVSGPSGIVVVGNSIQHPNAPNGTLGSNDEHRNIYAIWADPATGAHTVRWLTDFAPQGADDALDPRVVQVGPNRHAVLFSVQNASGYRMEYRLIDSAGTVLASKSFPGVFFGAESDPIMIGNTVYWAGVAPDSWDSSGPSYLFGIDVSDPTTPILNPSVTIGPTSVWRFRNLRNGFYLWSADPSEKATIINTLSGTWLYEGPAYTINTSNPLNSSPLWRFRNIRGGFYLYTADPNEKTTIINTLSGTWTYEGPAYNVSMNSSGNAPVWRFRNLHDGTYLYSADPNEKNTIVNTLGSTWQLEGPAYYLAP
jgi:hypothetical protein